VPCPSPFRLAATAFDVAIAPWSAAKPLDERPCGAKPTQEPGGRRAGPEKVEERLADLPSPLNHTAHRRWRSGWTAGDNFQHTFPGKSHSSMLALFFSPLVLPIYLLLALSLSFFPSTHSFTPFPFVWFWFCDYHLYIRFSSPNLGDLRDTDETRRWYMPDTTKVHTIPHIHT
jgi:hypothetical protein